MSGSGPDGAGEAAAPEAKPRPGQVFVQGVAVALRAARRQPVTFTLSVVGAAAYALASVAATVVLGRVTDDAILPAFDGGVTAGVVWGSVAAVAIVALLRGGSIVLRRYCAALTTYRTQADLRRRVTDHYLEVPLAYHRSHPTGELLARADADVLAASELLNALPFSLGVLVLVVVAVVSLALVDPLLTVVALLLFPTLAVLNRVYTNRIHRPIAVVQERVAGVSRVAHESFDGALVVKALGRADAEVARLDAAAERLRDARIDVGRLRASFEPTIDALPSIGTIALLGVGAWQISEGRLDTGGLVQAMALFAILATPVRIVGYFLQEIPRAVVATGRIDAVLAEPTAERPGVAPEGRPGGDGTRPVRTVLPRGPLAVALEDVTFAYGDHRALDHVSLTVAPGEVVALVGPTGSGKTTLCELLVRAADPTSGVVRVGGVDVRAADLDELRSAVALVFQEAFLFAAPLRDNVALGADLGDEVVAEALARAAADGFVADLPAGLGTVVGERGVTLSGGQRQRIALARALARRPRVLVLDDATSAVDPVVEARILDGLRASHDLTTLLVAHRLSTIELADRVVFLRRGVVAASGTHHELLADPAYAAIARAYERGER